MSTDYTLLNMENQILWERLPQSAMQATLIIDTQTRVMVLIALYCQGQGEPI